jgi:hypothetical protein
LVDRCPAGTFSSGLSVRRRCIHIPTDVDEAEQEQEEDRDDEGELDE